MSATQVHLYKRAYLLSIITIFYNILEGLVATILGYKDNTLALLGFGVDSFIEVVSGAGIALMILRIWHNPDSSVSKYEITALKITGTAFYLLSGGLLAGIVINIFNQHKPETTFWGIAISLISIAVMMWLTVAKFSIGKKLNSDPIIADANCSRVCVYMSLVLLISSVLYELTGFIYADILGAAGLIYLSISEGKEAFEKSRNKNNSYCQD